MEIHKGEAILSKWFYLPSEKGSSLWNRKKKQWSKSSKKIPFQKGLWVQDEKLEITKVVSPVKMAEKNNKLASVSSPIKE